MNIGIDIDDTITDTFDFLMDYIADYFGLDVNYLKENNISYLNLPEELKKHEKEFALNTYGRILNDVPVKNGAVENIKKLKEKGCNIFIITARDNTIYKHPFEATEGQLKKHNIYYDKIICSFDKKKACIDNNIDVLIDDSINNLDIVKEIGAKTILFNNKININIKTNHDRVDNWNELYNYIVNLMKDEN